jgi:hypothetical protein
VLAATASQAGAASACRPPAYPGSGYFTSITVTRVGCVTGRRVTLAHYRCRVRNGVRGRCPRRIYGYSCTEHRVAIPSEIDARVTCRRGARRVVYTYQQNL